METLSLHHHAHEDNLDEVKFALLYFDKIELPIYFTTYLHKIKGTKSYMASYDNYSTTDNYLKHIKILEDEGVLKIERKKYNSSTGTRDSHNLGMSLNGIGELVGNSLNRFFKNARMEDHVIDGKTTIHYSGDLIDELEKYSSDLNASGRTYSPHFEVIYVVAQLESILTAIDAGKPTFNTSPLIDGFLKEFFNSPKFAETQKKIQSIGNIEAQISMEALKLNLPNLSMLSFEDILDIKYIMKDELSAFKYEIKHLSLNFDMERYSKKNELSNYVAVNISPRLKSLERQLQSLNRNFIKAAIKEIKDPKSYSPLLLTFFDNVSNTLLLLCSLGIISIDVVADHLSKKNELKNDGLYFLAKLRNRTE